MPIINEILATSQSGRSKVLARDALSHGQHAAQGVAEVAGQVGILRAAFSSTGATERPGYRPRFAWLRL